MGCEPGCRDRIGFTWSSANLQDFVTCLQVSNLPGHCGALLPCRHHGLESRCAMMHECETSIHPSSVQFNSAALTFWDSDTAHQDTRQACMLSQHVLVWSVDVLHTSQNSFATAVPVARSLAQSHITVSISCQTPSSLVTRLHLQNWHVSSRQWFQPVQFLQLEDHLNITDSHRSNG